MTKQERIKFMAEQSVEYFTNTTTMFLKKFLDASVNGTTEQLAYSSVALWQLNQSMADFFKRVTSESLKIGGNKRTAQAIADNVAKMTTDRMCAIAIESRITDISDDVVPIAGDKYDDIQDEGVLAAGGKVDPSFN